jgi:hypothetical protein
MKVNAKDVAAGVLLILIAAIGLYLNQDHSLGSARRMGPGYMPMMVFWLQLGLGAFVLVAGLFNGPDPLEKWTGLDSVSMALGIAAGLIAWKAAPLLGGFFASTYNAVGVGMMVGFLVICFSAGWRLIGYVCASMCIFGLLLEKGGLMLALVGTIFVAAAAEPEHRSRPLGVLGMTVFLLALCWWIFIKQLDIRVSVWPQF